MKAMFIKKLALMSALATVMAASVALEPPVVNIDPARHGNLAAAQQMIRQAYERLGDAQVANNSQLGGHAARAKELLSEASQEIKMAAMTANER